jgi:hypothetical protein
MASKDKMLGRLSDWSTLVVIVGVAALPLLPGHYIARAPSKAPPRVEARPAPVAPTQAHPAGQVSQPATPDTGTQSAPVPDVWTEAEQAAGLRECLRLLAPVAAEVTLDEPIRRGQCGTPAPLLLQSVGTAAKVEFHPPPKMNCRLAAEMAGWIDKVLQPAAREVLGSRVTRIVGASSYSCRNIYNKPDLPLSQHATGNAVDIVGFVTADGRSISVGRAWGPTERDIVAAQTKIAEAKAAESAAAKKKNEASTGEASASAPDEASRAKEKGDVHKAGFKAGDRIKPPVVAAAASVTAAKTSESAFLKRLHRGACTMFGTVLGPEANEAHRDHFHFDVKERKGPGVCH